MVLDEFTAILRARGFVSRVNPTSVPVPMQPYLDEAGAVLRRDEDLQSDEAGCSFHLRGKLFICVNASEQEERQRFTICHEIAHSVLGVPSEHSTTPWSGKRPPAERVCDSFAAELLLPKRLFQPLAEKSAVGLESVDALADRFVASTTATGSRYAAVISTPCAFVISENGKIRYASRSKPLIDERAWIRPGADVPRGTVSKRAIEGEATLREEVPAEEWFSDWERGGTLIEEARHLARWNRTLSLLWFESEEVPPPVRDRDRPRWEVDGREIDEHRDDEEDGLEELGGNLRWPGSRRRR